MRVSIRIFGTATRFLLGWFDGCDDGSADTDGLMEGQVLYVGLTVSVGLEDGCGEGSSEGNSEGIELGRRETEGWEVGALDPEYTGKFATHDTRIDCFPSDPYRGSGQTLGQPWSSCALNPVFMAYSCFRGIRPKERLPN